MSEFPQRSREQRKDANLKRKAAAQEQSVRERSRREAIKPKYARQLESEEGEMDEDTSNLLSPFQNIQKNGEKTKNSLLFITEGTETAKLMLKSEVEVVGMVMKEGVFYDEVSF